MSDKGGAYEHDNRMAGPDRGQSTGGTGGNASSTAPAGDETSGVNEIDVRERNEEIEDVREPGRTPPHGPETHQDTSFTRKSGS